MDIKKVPAPWTLKGEGYIFLYKFKKSLIKSQGIVTPDESNNFAGGFGAMMIVDYFSSDVGPYKELLFIPGKFKLFDRKWNRISKIYVSSQESVENGRINWGIPKEIANFSFEKSSANIEKIEVSSDNNEFFSASIKSLGFKFPVNTAFMPFPLMQPYNGHYLQTTFKGKGIGRIAKLEDIWIDENYFADISKVKPIAVIKVTDFNICFPEAIKY